MSVVLFIQHTIDTNSDVRWQKFEQNYKKGNGEELGESVIGMNRL